MKISKRDLEHPVAKVSGVHAGDTKIEAAEKAVATMRLAGFSAAAIRKAEKMIADAKKRGVK